MKRFKKWLRKKVLGFLQIEITTSQIIVNTESRFDNRVLNDVDIEEIAEKLSKLARRNLQV